ncbi:MAG: hypothetical protein GX121_03155 [Ignavibacteria bacterium]|nr:hypothetical protein [Ignavibacteria bacterium]
MKQTTIVLTKKNLRIPIIFTILLIISIFLSFNSNLFSQTNYQDLMYPAAGKNQRIFIREFMLEDNSGTKLANKDKKLKANETKADTNVKKSNKISAILERRDGEGYYLQLELEDYEQRIQIAAYNLLGKKVLDIYSGTPINDPEYRYDIRTNNLPNGVYICFVFGKNFRLQEKFVVSR